MLKNITGKTIKVRYNGIVKELKKNGIIDVRDFDIMNKNVNSVEKHIMTKIPKTFSREKSTGDSDTDKAFNDKISELEVKLKAAQDETGKLRETNKELAENVQISSGELQTEKERADSLKKETDDATVKMKDLEEEVEKLRLQIAEGPKDQSGEVKALKEENEKLTAKIEELTPEEGAQNDNPKE